MKTKLLISYSIAIFGIILLVWIAYNRYIADNDINEVSSGSALILCVIGVILVKKYRNKR